MRQRKQIILAILLLLFCSSLFAGTTGKLAGRVKDENGKPVPFANVILEGTTIGSQSESDGKYIIINIPPGIYTVIFSQMGFQHQKIKNVEIKADETTIQNVTMTTTAVTIDGFVVKENKLKKINRTKTSSGNKVTSEAIDDMAVSEIENIISVQAGATVTGGELFVSGGRTNEVIYMIDGMSVSDPVDAIRIPRVDWNTEEYNRIYENEFKEVKENPLSTFSIDVDAASYSNMRRFINSNRLPPKDAVRIEELINYFDYDYPQPRGEHPFSIITEYADCPWNEKHKLFHIGLQGKKMDLQDVPNSNLTFLIDVSGSMSNNDKLPLLIKAFKMLVKNLNNDDRISIVVYAGAAGLVLPSTPGNKKEKILDALENLKAGGSTAGGAGIKLAYKIAEENFLKDGNNRVILATDGDFNTGVSSTSEMIRLIEESRDKGIFLTVLGFGRGNLKDDKMEQIADKGNGNYYYIDSILEGKKVLINEMGATLFTIAKDVKIQVEFNPAKVKAYRLIGYENRMLKKEDFNDDTKDAGEIGAGHTVTALYELILKDGESDVEIPKVDDLKYQEVKTSDFGESSKELLTVKFRYKEPDEDTSKLIEKTVISKDIKLKNTSDNFRFSAAVAGFGLLLRDSKFKEDCSYNQVLKLAKGAKGKDEFGYRAEFIRLVEITQLLKNSEK